MKCSLDLARQGGANREEITSIASGVLPDAPPIRSARPSRIFAFIDADEIGSNTYGRARNCNALRMSDRSSPEASMTRCSSHGSVRAASRSASARPFQWRTKVEAQMTCRHSAPLYQEPGSNPAVPAGRTSQVDIGSGIVTGESRCASTRST